LLSVTGVSVEKVSELILVRGARTKLEAGRDLRMTWLLAKFGGLLLMMGHNSRSESLFYYFKLEDQVPENHLLKTGILCATTFAIVSLNGGQPSGLI
jgi:hypothetical protein